MHGKVILKKGKYNFKLKTFLSALEVKLEESVVDEIAYFSAEFSTINDDIQNKREDFIKLLKNKELSDNEKRAIISEDVEILTNDYHDLKNHYFELREKIKNKGAVVEVVEFIDKLMDELTHTINNYHKYLNDYIDEIENLDSKELYRELIKLELINQSIKSILKGGTYFFKTYLLKR